jgi:hypothetical protein
MLDAYFCPRVVRRLRASPEASTIDSFVAYLHRRSHTRLTIQCYGRAAEVYLRSLRRRRKSLASIDEIDVRAFASRRRSKRRPRPNVHAALRHLVRHLRQESVIAPRPAPADQLWESMVAEYDVHLWDAGGLPQRRDSTGAVTCVSSCRPCLVGSRSDGTGSTPSTYGPSSPGTAMPDTRLLLK